MMFVLPVIAAIPIVLGLFACMVVHKLVRAPGISDTKAWTRWGMSTAVSFCWSVLGYALWPSWYEGSSPTDAGLVLIWGVPWLIFLGPSYVTFLGVLFVAPLRRLITLRCAFALLAICSVALTGGRLIMRIGAEDRTRLDVRRQARLRYEHELATSEYEFISEAHKLDERIRQRLFGGQFTSINLAGTDITDQDLRMVNFSSLKSLYLSRTQIGDVSLSIIADAPQLEVLDIGNTQVTQKGLHALTKSSSLMRVTVEGVQFDDTAIDILEQSPSLDRIWAGGTSISRSRLEKFHKRQKSKVTR